MKSLSRVYRSVTLLFMVSILLALVSVQQPAISPTHAAGGETWIPLDNAQEDFAADEHTKFQRTALSAKLVPGLTQAVKDSAGAVQLMPVGALTKFTVAPQRLPTRIADMGYATLNNYIYLIGGNERQQDNTVVRTNKVFVGTVNEQTGVPTWVDNESNYLPYRDVTSGVFGGKYGTPGQMAAIAYPAVTIVPDSAATSDNNGYIYVIGGFGEVPGLISKINGSEASDISSAAVIIGRITDGALQWLETPGPMIPHPTDADKSWGIHGASATSVKIGTRTFLYVIGGLQNYFEPTGDNDYIRGSQYIYYAEVGAEGKLYKPGTTEEGWSLAPSIWRGTQQNGIIPVPEAASDQNMGLWFGNAVHYAATAEVGATNADYIYLIGGQRSRDDANPYQFSNIIYRAEVHGDGSLNWDTDNWTGLLPGNALYKQASGEFDGFMFIAGGDDPKDTGYELVLSNYFDTARQLDVDEYGSTELHPGKDEMYTRSDHALGIVRNTNANTSTLAYFYVMGGRSEEFPDGDPKAGLGTDPGDESSQKGTDTVLMSRIDPDAVDPKIYLLSGGWYYSRQHDVWNYNKKQDDGTYKTELIGLSWTALVSRTESITTDIQIDYRVDKDPCDKPGVFAELDEGWHTLTTTLDVSGTQTVYTEHNGFNEADFQLSDVAGEIGCLQYRAHFSTNHSNYTPALLNVAVRAITEKRADLFIVDGNEGLYAIKNETTGMYTDLRLVIQNLFEDDVNKTFNADFDGYPSKSFFIDLYIFAPDQTSFNKNNNPPPMPFIDGETEPITAVHHLYTTLLRSSMPAEDTYPRDGNDQAVWEGKWKRVDDDKIVEIPSVLASLTETGIYTACVIVDSFVSQDEASTWKYGYVNEGDETNNFRCIPLEVEPILLKACIQPDMPEGVKNAAEKGTIQGTFTISLTEKLETDMKVSFKLLGTASITTTEGVDYTFDQEATIQLDDTGTAGTITLPKDIVEYQFSFTPVDDNWIERDETVTVKLVAPSDALYLVMPVDGTDCQEQATILIEENDFGVYLPTIFRQLP